ncbi:MAG TPA: sensor histidine kinase [Baekduia sp.]|uniref:sensor histidine kinase n=1 Tax=Baekduia sp. TaxID=2600305 RepID=UPI002D78241A|nr:sensor histidine kinase [Baekduia sp.]HET6505394.1 sensor histidine kinase [Baekduia sp.]
MARRLLLAYAAVLGCAVLVLVFAPVTISVPVSTTELIGILLAFAVMLVVTDALLRRVLAPLHRLTELMQTIDPLAPGQRVAISDDAEEVARLSESFNMMLDRLERERRESARRALRAQEGERRRVARELHDEVGQVLTGIVLRSETLARLAGDNLRPGLEELREAAREGAEDVRRIAQRLRPEALDELGLQSALLGLVASMSESSGLEVDRDLGRDLGLDSEQELVVYRVAQEGLTNVVRHARARHVWLRLGACADGVELVVGDDGGGLPRHADQMGSGMRGMRERAVLIGARFDIGARDGGGTELRLVLPREELR